MELLLQEEKSEVINWIKKQFEDSKKDKAIVAFTDHNSVVSISLLIKSIGVENVILVCFNSTDSDIIHKIFPTAKKFYFQSPEKIVEGFKLRLPKTATLSIEVPSYEKNLAERVKMTALYSLANMTNGLVVGSLNKTQDLIGDYVKFGNVTDIEPLKGFYESNIIDYYNSLNLEIGTVGLKVEYKEIEIVLKTLLEGDELEKDFSKEKFDTVLKKMKETEHKRITSPFYGEMD